MIGFSRPAFSLVFLIISHVGAWRGIKSVLELGVISGVSVKAGLWTLDWIMDWTTDWTMDWTRCRI